MSKGNNKNGLYVDTGLLRDHVSKLRAEKKLAARLYESVSAMRAVADPASIHRYDSALRDIEQMIEYFSAMANQLAHIDDEAVRLSHEMRGLIEDSSDLNQRIIAENSML